MLTLEIRSSTWSLARSHTDSIFRQIIHQTGAKSSSTIPSGPGRTGRGMCASRCGRGREIILRGALLSSSSSSPVSCFRNGCPWFELVTVGEIVHLCFPWRGCGSGPEQRLFFGDFSSGEPGLWGAARHTSTKDPGPGGQTRRPMPGLASEQKPNRKPSPRIASWPL